jgi:hypothetical protein
MLRKRSGVGPDALGFGAINGVHGQAGAIDLIFDGSSMGVLMFPFS